MRATTFWSWMDMAMRWLKNTRKPKLTPTRTTLVQIVSWGTNWRVPSCRVTTKVSRVWTKLARKRPMVTWVIASCTKR